MNNEMYTLLNEIDNQAELYDNAPAAKEEVAAWKKRFERKDSGIFARKKGYHWKGYVAAAAALLFLVGASCGPVRETVYAQSKYVAYNLSKLLNVRDDLSPYSSVVGTSVSKDGVTVTLNEVVLNSDTLTISYTAKVSDKYKKGLKSMDDLMLFANIYRNGKLIAESYGGSVWKVDGNTVIGTEEAQIDNPDALLKGTNDLEIKLSVCDAADDSDHVDVGKIAFSVSGEELAEDTGAITLNKDITMPDGRVITLKKYTSNAMGQKIAFVLKGKSNESYDIKLEGKDNLGNPVIFSTSYYDTESGTGELEVYYSKGGRGLVLDTAAFLKLTPYGQKLNKKIGYSDDDYKIAGEDIVISLK